MEETGSFYAGIDEGEVAQEAMNALGREVRAPDSPLYRHTIRLGGVLKGHATGGKEAWVVRVVDRTIAKSICVRVWAQGALNVRQYSSEVDICRPDEAAASSRA